MRNTINIKRVFVEKSSTIKYEYDISGEWRRYFNCSVPYFIEYNEDISSVPESVLVVPLLANILPIVWICDAEILLNECDKDFFYSIPEFKEGYKHMYPMINFQGNIICKKIVANENRGNGAGMFFSGGVDAFNTLVCHHNEKPVLLTVWGADILHSDISGWMNVLSHVKKTAADFNLEYVTIKTSFRMVLNEKRLSKLVKKSGDGWWHGFQHGIGLIGHAAPVAYIKHIPTIYIASSFTKDDVGVTCASDPSIDNYVKYCGTKTIHDGYEFNRQQKIENIVSFVQKNGIKIQLRVCWISSGGKNCCSCEKCFRTMMGLAAENENPAEYGFYTFNAEELKYKLFYKFYFPSFIIGTWKTIQKRCAETHSNDLSWKWFVDFDFDKINDLGHKKLKKTIDQCVLLRAVRKIVYTLKKKLFI